MNKEDIPPRARDELADEHFAALDAEDGEIRFFETIDTATPFVGRGEAADRE